MGIFSVAAYSSAYSSASGSAGWQNLGASYSDPHLDCPLGITPATTRGENPEVWNALSLEMAKRVDKIYWLCVRDGCDVSFPDEIFDKVIVMRGEEVDVCNDFGGVGGHTLQSSAMHLLATMHGYSEDATQIMILEQDTVLDPLVEWTAEDWDSFDAASADKEWKMIRLGYRPLSYEMNGDHVCEGQCMCTVATSKSCYLGGTGCDLRAADAYVVHSRFFGQYIDAFQGPDALTRKRALRLTTACSNTPWIATSS